MVDHVRHAATNRFGAAIAGQIVDEHALVEGLAHDYRTNL